MTMSRKPSPRERFFFSSLNRACNALGSRRECLKKFSAWCFIQSKHASWSQQAGNDPSVQCPLFEHKYDGPKTHPAGLSCPRHVRDLLPQVDVARLVFRRRRALKLPKPFHVESRVCACAPCLLTSVQVPEPAMCHWSLIATLAENRRLAIGKWHCVIPHRKLRGGFGRRLLSERKEDQGLSRITWIVRGWPTSWPLSNSPIEACQGASLSHRLFLGVTV